MVTKLLNCASFPFKSLRVVLFLMVTKPYVDGMRMRTGLRVVLFLMVTKPSRGSDGTGKGLRVVLF